MQIDSSLHFPVSVGGSWRVFVASVWRREMRRAGAFHLRALAAPPHDRPSRLGQSEPTVYMSLGSRRVSRLQAFPRHARCSASRDAARPSIAFSVTICPALRAAIHRNPSPPYTPVESTLDTRTIPRRRGRRHTATRSVAPVATFGPGKSLRAQPRREIAVFSLRSAHCMPCTCAVQRNFSNAVVCNYCHLFDK